MTKRIYLTKFRDVNRGVRCEVMMQFGDAAPIRLGVVWFTSGRITAGADFQFYQGALVTAFGSFPVDSEMDVIAMISKRLGDAGLHGGWDYRNGGDFQVYPIPEEDKS